MTVAEGAETVHTREAGRVLQWGRNLTVAEGALLDEFNRTMERFNGAAT